MCSALAETLAEHLASSLPRERISPLSSLFSSGAYRDRTGDLRLAKPPRTSACAVGCGRARSHSCQRDRPCHAATWSGDGQDSNRTTKQFGRFRYGLDPDGGTSSSGVRPCLTKPPGALARSHDLQRFSATHPRSKSAGLTRSDLLCTTGSSTTLDLGQRRTYTQSIGITLFTDKRGAAEIIGLSPKTIERLIQRGEITAFKPAGKIRIRCQDLFAWLETVRVQPSVHEI